MFPLTCTELRAFGSTVREFEGSFVGARVGIVSLVPSLLQVFRGELG